MAAFAAAILGAATPQDEAGWRAFLQTIGQAHAADVEGIRGAQTSGDRPPKSILFEQAHRPEKFADDRDPKATITFKQWTSDVRSMVRRYKKKFGKIMDVAVDRSVWNDQDLEDELKDEGVTVEEIADSKEKI